MVESLLNLIVTRAIPPEVLMGLMTKQYKLFGGVVRWAPGTQNAGQIIRHLLPVATETTGAPILAPILSAMGKVNTYQLLG